MNLRDFISFFDHPLKDMLKNVTVLIVKRKTKCFGQFYHASFKFGKIKKNFLRIHTNVWLMSVRYAHRPVYVVTLELEYKSKKFIGSRYRLVVPRTAQPGGVSIFYILFE